MINENLFICRTNTLKLRYDGNISNSGPVSSMGHTMHYKLNLNNWLLYQMLSLIFLKASLLLKTSNSPFLDNKTNKEACERGWNGERFYIRLISSFAFINITLNSEHLFSSCNCNDLLQSFHIYFSLIRPPYNEKTTIQNAPRLFSLFDAHIPPSSPLSPNLVNHSGRKYRRSHLLLHVMSTKISKLWV